MSEIVGGIEFRWRKEEKEERLNCDGNWKKLKDALRRGIHELHCKRIFTELRSYYREAEEIDSRIIDESW